jgi:hypothetical protein
MKILRSFLSLLLITLTALVLTFNLNIKAKAAAADSTVNYSTWLWNARELLQNQDNIIYFLKSKNVSTLYLQIDYGLSNDSYKAIIRNLSANNISVHALDGSPDWVSSNGLYYQNLFFDWLANYQMVAASDEKFKGINLDVEPYLNVQYSKNPNQVIKYYQDCLTSALSRSKTLGLYLSVDIPFWFDGVKYNTKYGKGILAEWVIRNVKNVVVMAYRDNASGLNGIISLTETEVNLAIKYGGKITIAAETRPSAEGAFITFYEEGSDYMNTQLTSAAAYYKDNTGFSGFAVHDLDGWMALK